MSIESVKSLYNAAGIEALNRREIERLVNSIISERDNALAQNAELKKCSEERKAVCRQAFDANDAQSETIKQLATQNAELVAQVEALRDHLVQFPKTETLEDAVAWEDKAKTLTRTTPTQYLRDRDAEVGRAGFVACAECYGNQLYTSSELIKAADQYAEKVRRGEV